MAQEFSKSFYDSEVWKKCRRDYISKVHGLCERCVEPTPGLILHHKIELTPDNIDDPNITLNHDNLLYVCKSCHEALHRNYKATRDNLKFNSDGDIVPIPPVV